MAQTADGRKYFTLYEVTKSISKTISDRYSQSYWIMAEIHKLNITKKGFCNPELVEKAEGSVMAEMRGTIWKQDFDRINRNFLNVVNEPLKDGIRVLLKASIQFHPVYGLSLAILDIDPNYSLGELEKEKKETIQKLQKEGIYGKNKLLTLPLLPQRIAIISVDTSKGYSDFLQVIDGNKFGYRFFHMLFPAVLQGDSSSASIARQLHRIKKVKSHFDAVAIIRGGGGEVGLSAYNNYQMAKIICNFPLPVFTGIGHSTNLTVAEMVAFQNAITPTQLGEIFLQLFHNFAVPVQDASAIVLHETLRLITNEKMRFETTTRLFRNLTKNRLKTCRDEIRYLSSGLMQEAKFRIGKEQQQLTQAKHTITRSTKELVSDGNEELKNTERSVLKESIRFISMQHDTIKNMEKVVALVDPMNVIKRGYTLTTINGELLKSVDQLQTGDVINTLTADGAASSKIISTKKN